MIFFRFFIPLLVSDVAQIKDMIVGQRTDEGMYNTGYNAKGITAIGDFFFIPVSSLKVYDHTIYSKRRKIYLG